MVINLVEHLRIKNIKRHTILGCFRKWNYKSEIGTKNSLSMPINSNIQNKYVPIRGVKYFHGKMKTNYNPTNKNKNYIYNLIDNYKNSTIPTSNSFNTNTYNNNHDRIEVVHNKMNLNDNFRTFNDCKTLEHNNNIIINNSNNYLKIPSKNQNSNCIYHRKVLGVSLKNNINNNYNIYSNTKNKNYQYTNDSINTTLIIIIMDLFFNFNKQY